MWCPCCKKKTTFVIDSRDIDPSTIRRRRECASCHYRFTTYEKIDPVKLTVIKKNGTLQPYSRDKIAAGVALATEKLDVTTEKIESIIDRVEQDLLQTGEPQVSSAKIGQLVLKELRHLDEVAYLRFNSVYKAFSSIKSFEKELKKINKNK